MPLSHAVKILKEKLSQLENLYLDTQSEDNNLKS